MPLGKVDVPYVCPVEIASDGRLIPDTLTVRPGWSGVGVHQAGQSCALKDYSDSYGHRHWGYICTPRMHLGGDVVINLRARRLAGSRGNLTISVVYDDSDELVDTEYFELTNRWVFFKCKLSGIAAKPWSMIRFGSESGPLVIDDITIEFTRNELIAPQHLSVTNHSPMSFTASWDDMTVDNYSVDLYTLTERQDAESGVFGEGFDSGIPAGWKSVDTELEYQPENCGDSAPALAFTRIGASVVTPKMPLPVNKVNFHIVPVSTDTSMNGLSLLRIDAHHADTDIWESLTYISTYDCLEEGGTDVSIESDILGTGVDALRFVLADNFENGFYIDDIVMEYATEPRVDYVFRQCRVTEPSIELDGLDGERDYYFYVYACDNGAVSEQSESLWLDGITGLKVADFKAVVEDRGVVNATWSPLPHADDYLVSLSTIITAYDNQLNSVTIFDDEFDAGQDNTFWQAVNPVWTDDCIGTLGVTPTGEAGYIYSPAIDLGCNGGRGFFVDATIITDYDDITISLLHSLNDNNPLAVTAVPCPLNGYNSVRVWVDTEAVEDLSDVIIAFSSAGGNEFYLDRVWVSQNLLPGETLKVPFGVPVVTDVPGVYLTDLSYDVNHIMRVTARAVRGRSSYISAPSDPVTAYTAVSVTSPEIDESDDSAQTWDILGRPATSASRLIITRKGKTIVPAD